MWFYASVMTGSHGFCGGRGSESPLDLLVHSEICQRESSASVLWTYLSMTVHGTLTRKRRRLPGDKHWVAACFGVTDWYTSKDFPGIVTHDFAWLQRQLISWQRWLWGDCWVNGSVMSITRGYTLTINRKRISWSRLVKLRVNKLTAAEARYLRQKP